MIKCAVNVKYRDDKVETFLCWDSPLFTSDGLLLYGDVSHFSRRFIPKEAIAQFDYDFVDVPDEEK